MIICYVFARVTNLY